MCRQCGAVETIQDNAVPPSGMVGKCSQCGGPVTFTPPGMGLLGEDSLGFEASSASSPVASDEIIDLPAPKTQNRPQPELPDLLTPVGPRARPRQELPDLLAPVGPTSRRGNTDYLTPVSAARSAPDLLAPVGPTSTRNAPDLLSPVGPTSTRNAPDLLSPVGPYPVRNAPDLMAPVGPEPIRNAPDLMTPVGPEPIRNAPDLMTPVGPAPTKGVDLPAPKGFFDEAPPPRSAGPGRQAGVASLDLDDLDIVPAGGTGASAIDLSPLMPESGPREGSNAFNMDGLDLSSPPSMETPAFDTGMSYGEVDLPPQQTEDSGLVSFSRPTGTKAPSEPVMAGAAARAIDLGGAPRRKQGTLAGDAGVAAEADPGAVGPTRRELQEKKQKRRSATIFAVGALVALGAGAFYTYTNVELTLGSFLTEPARERQDKIASGLTMTRRSMRADEQGHWHRAIAAAQRVVPLYQGPALEPQALIAQAHLAAAYDEGLKVKQDRDAADAIVSDLLKSGSKDVETEKAIALRSLLDGKAGEAHKQLEGLARKAPKDADAPLFQGWAALESGDPAKAQQAFNRALQLAPNRQTALVGLGRAQMALGERAKAKETFQKVFDRPAATKHYGAWLAITELTTTARDPQGLREKELGVLCERAPEREKAHPRDRSRAWSLYGDEALARGRYEQAMERFRVARELDPRNISAMVGRAIATIELRSSTTGGAVPAMTLLEARRELEQALMLEPKNVTALIGLARINLLEGRPSEARKNIEDALALDEKNALAHYWRGRILEDPTLNAGAEAEKSYQRAIELAPSDYGAFVALSKLYLGRATELERTGKKAEATALRERAVTLLGPVAAVARTDAPMANVLGSVYRASHDLASAEKWFRAALAVDAGYTDARLNLAATLETAGRPADAVAQYRAAYAAAPRREDAALGLALALERSKDLAGAEKIYLALLSTDGGNVPSARAHAAAGRYWARRDRVDLARAQGEKLASIDPQNPAASFLQGVGLVADGKPGDALKLFRIAVALDPQAQYHEIIGRVTELQGSLAEAQAAYEQAIRLDPAWAPPLIGLGRVHLARREFRPALAALERATRLDEETPAIWTGIGDAYFGMLWLEQAAAAYRQSLARDDTNAFVHFSLAKALNGDGRPEAADSFQRAIKLAPAGATWLPQAWRLLGFRLKANGDRAGMCQALRKYLTMAPPRDLMLDDAKKESASCR